MPAKTLSFIATNVFVYHVDNFDECKSGIAHKLIRDALAHDRFATWPTGQRTEHF